MNPMQCLRTSLAVMIAIALALLPIGASVAGFVRIGDQAATVQLGSPHEQMGSPDDMSAAMAMDECCPDAKANPCNHDGGKCPLGCCVVPFVGLADAGGLRFDVPPLRRDAVLIPADQVTSLLGASPPFRPPRV